MGGSAGQKKYNYPATDDYSAAVHTPAGVAAIRQHSTLMQLLHDLETDGCDIGAPMAELIALLNYVTHSHVVLGDMATHLEYCLQRARADLQKK